MQPHGSILLWHCGPSRSAPGRTDDDTDPDGCLAGGTATETFHDKDRVRFKGTIWLGNSGSWSGRREHIGERLQLVQPCINSLLGHQLLVGSRLCHAPVVKD